MGGAVCYPTVYNAQSTWLFYFLFLPAWIVIPFGIILYTSILIWRHKLLPPVGHHGRVLAIFFYRLIGVYLFFWIPTCILLVLAGVWGYWFAFAGAFWAHAQGFVSALFVLQKKDVGRIYYYTWTCQRYILEDESYIRSKPRTRSGIISISFESNVNTSEHFRGQQHSNTTSVVETERKPVDDEPNKQEISPPQNIHGEATAKELNADSNTSQEETSPYLEDGDIEDGSLLAMATSNNNEMNELKDDSSSEKFQNE